MACAHVFMGIMYIYIYIYELYLHDHELYLHVHARHVFSPFRFCESVGPGG